MEYYQITKKGILCKKKKKRKKGSKRGSKETMELKYSQKMIKMAL